MPKEGSVAPKERVNIVYKPATDGSEEVELPLKILAIGDYTGRADDRALEDRKPINIDKDNFNEVMEKHDLGADLNVPDKLSGADDGELAVSLKFKNLKDFTPEGVANQVPELKKLLELRNALTALKGPLGNRPAFRKQMQDLLGNDAARKKLMEELGMGEGGGGGGE
ncbi:MAG: type VI secretion system contractile sheath small subunit [Myxococcales bacterium]|nr:type VI secretion system contractile sheath small subunit [Myxococcales bacterium]